MKNYKDNLGGLHVLADSAYEYLLKQNNPSLTFTQITQAEADALQNPPKTAAQIQQELRTSAQIALDRVTGPSGTIMRCIVVGVPIPAEWSAHVIALRAIANGTDTTNVKLPVQPPFPSGT